MGNQAGCGGQRKDKFAATEQVNIRATVVANGDFQCPDRDVTVRRIGQARDEIDAARPGGDARGFYLVKLRLNRIGTIRRVQGKGDELAARNQRMERFRRIISDGDGLCAGQKRELSEQSGGCLIGGE
ncbi:hypothetical protein [Sneathiella sp.]|uniref:hypothetical protein n=1 Tax=Sneathiella sp. TaxID=1964365 RepID=UPI0035661CB7